MKSKDGFHFDTFHLEKPLQRFISFHYFLLIGHITLLLSFDLSLSHAEESSLPHMTTYELTLPSWSPVIHTSL
jgi:hypothetical protein